MSEQFQARRSEVKHDIPSYLSTHIFSDGMPIALFKKWLIFEQVLSQTVRQQP
jgi:hypothetical protein